MDRDFSYRQPQRVSARKRRTDAAATAPANRIAGLASVGLIVVLSLVPGQFEIRTGLPGEVEHFSAYLVAGALLAAVRIARPTVIIAAMAAVASVLEVAQNLVSGRNPAFTDAVVSGLGAACGVGLVHLFLSRRGKRGAATTTQGR
jgi:VanZ family protein